MRFIITTTSTLTGHGVSRDTPEEAIELACNLATHGNVAVITDTFDDAEYRAPGFSDLLNKLSAEIGIS